ncbi:MAG: hypothetical protein L3J63_13555 [Geopsychrobacter sp.]|nr:hypothetical protein [Geopsychrobacter sp.]
MDDDTRFKAECLGLKSYSIKEFLLCVMLQALSADNLSCWLQLFILASDEKACEDGQQAARQSVGLSLNWLLIVSLAVMKEE